MGELPFSATLHLGGQFSFEEADSAAAPEAGATARLARFRLSARRNRIWGKKGFPRVSTYPACARFRFGDWRLGEVRHSADIPAGIAGNQKKFTACAL